MLLMKYIVPKRYQNCKKEKEIDQYRQKRKIIRYWIISDMDEMRQSLQKCGKRDGNPDMARVSDKIPYLVDKKKVY